MTGFNDGDRVRILTWDGHTGEWDQPNPVGKTGYVHDGGVFEKPNGGGRYYCLTSGNRLELVTKGGEMKPYQRKTYRLKKAMPGYAAGTLFQEECDDGTQPYQVFNNGVSGITVEFRDRSFVEDNPQWFEEVFKVEPEYMNREELDKWDAFKGKKKPGRKPAASRASLRDADTGQLYAAKRRKKRGESARRSAAAKAAWARRKAAQAA